MATAHGRSQPLRSMACHAVEEPGCTHAPLMQVMAQMKAMQEAMKRPEMQQQVHPMWARCCRCWHGSCSLVCGCFGSICWWHTQIAASPTSARGSLPQIACMRRAGYVLCSAAACRMARCTAQRMLECCVVKRVAAQCPSSGACVACGPGSPRLTNACCCKRMCGPAQMAEMQAAMQNQQLKQRMEGLKNDPEFAEM